MNKKFSSARITQSKKKEKKKFNSSCISLLSTCRIVTKVPSNKLLQPSLQIRGGFVPKLPMSQTNIGMSKLHIPIPWQLHNTPLSLHLQKPLQNGNQIRNRNWRSVPQIENSQLGRTLLLPATTSTFLSSIQCT
ncbi:hypothetical protein LINPERHAP2_LOCUS35431 [Linum perenne]